jgi:hypothetical protein
MRDDGLNLPHASEKLNETAISERKRDDDVGRADSLGLHVDQGQDERGQGKGRESERRWVGEVACRRAVETRLEFTTEGCETHVGIVGRDVGKGVAAVVIGRPLLGQGAIVSVILCADAVALLIHAGAALGVC